MLQTLDVDAGMRVLEVGTGTGYNAALLAERLGAGNGTTVEVDPTLAKHARAALARAGYPVTVVTGDGEDGYPPHARSLPALTPGSYYASDAHFDNIRCMSRTTIDLDPVVLDQLKVRQREEGKTLGRLASELLARALSDTDTRTASPLRWTAANLGLKVDLDDKDAVARALGDDEPR